MALCDAESPAWCSYRGTTDSYLPFIKCKFLIICLILLFIYLILLLPISRYHSRQGRIPDFKKGRVQPQIFTKTNGQVEGQVKDSYQRRRKVGQKVKVWIPWISQMDSPLQKFFRHIKPEDLRYEVKVVVHDYAEPNATEPLIRGLKAEKGYLVPNIIHFILFGKNKTLKFIHDLSVLSAFRVQRPKVVMFHCNNLPVGPWWEKLWHDVPLQIIHKEPPPAIHSQPLTNVYHQSDTAKMEVLKLYAGMYLDFDVIVINSLDPLRKYPMVLGREKMPNLIAGIMIAERNALFLRLLYESYRKNYWGNLWDYNYAYVSYRLYLNRPDLVHVEMEGLTTPDWTERHLLYENTIDWRKLYVLHLMWHGEQKSISPESIQTMKGILGDVLRNVYYGDPKRIP